MADTALEAAREKAAARNPAQAARNCGFAYEDRGGEGRFSFPILGRPARLSFPNLELRGSSDHEINNPALVTILLYHLAQCDGTPLALEWIDFSELPGGQYSQAMQKYTSDRIERHFSDRFDELGPAAELLAADPIDLGGDLSLKFEVFPKVPVGLVIWRGDEEFPNPRASFLFDRTAAHHLPTDCYAILCSLLTTGLIDQVDPVR